MQKSTESLHFDEIQIFSSVALTGSFTVAAQSLGRDASVLSRRISGLEARLGVKLLNRTTRRVSLTEAGVAYLDRVRAILAALEEADAEAASVSIVAKGVLRVSAPANFGRLRVAPLLPEFLSANPEVQVDLRLTNRYVDLIAENIDVAVRLGVLKDSSLLTRKVASHRRLLCAAPDYLARRGTPEQPADLADHECLGLTNLATHPQWVFRKGAERVAVSISGPFSADDSEALIPACVASAGIMTCADWLVGRELADGRLVPVMFDWALEDEGAIHVVTPSAPFMARKTRAFIDWFAARMSPVPPWSRWPS
jgi:DNA-binding transcriptional LysR family regulator